MKEYIKIIMVVTCIYTMSTCISTAAINYVYGANIFDISNTASIHNGIIQKEGDISSEEDTYAKNDLSSVYCEVPQYNTSALSVPTYIDTSFKGYMCLHKITCESSNQYKFLRSGQFDVTTDSLGFVKYGKYYVVAMGNSYANGRIGDTFRITLDSGKKFSVIVGDVKADCDTDATNSYRPKGDGKGEVIEFIIACGSGSACSKYQCMSSQHKALGNLSSLGFEGNVTKIERINDTSVTSILYE